MFGKIGVHVAGGATTAQLLRKETALLAEDDYHAQQKNKHQKMDYAEARRIAQEC